MSILGILASGISGHLTPPTFTVDFLVVAGGGGGGGFGGGGGAGGLRSTVGNTGGGGSLETALDLSPSTNYSIYIGLDGYYINNKNRYRKFTTSAQEVIDYVKEHSPQLFINKLAIDY